MEGPQFLHLLRVFCQNLELQVALTCRKSLFWVKRRLHITFFNADHHFEAHKIGFEILTNNQMYRREVYSLLIAKKARH